MARSCYGGCKRKRGVTQASASWAALKNPLEISADRIIFAGRGEASLSYNIYIFNAGGISAAANRTVLSGTQMGEIARTLQGYFDKVVTAHDALGLRGAPKYGNSAVQWLAGSPTVAPHELLIYFMPFGTTIATNGKLEMGKPPAGHDGLTNPNLRGGTASEVYAHFADTTLLANLMFHEAMHNKLALGNLALHTHGGLANGVPGGMAIEAATPLTPSNIQEMARALDANRPQWTAGIQMLVAESSRSDNDPLKGLL